jgi:hypothetical protein
MPWVLMTQAEYRSLYKKARSQFPRIQASVSKEIRSVYLQAADDAAAIVRQTTEAGLSELTSGSWRAIEEQLRASASAISTATDNGIKTAINESYWGTVQRPGYGRIDTAFLLAAAPEGLFSANRLTEIAVGVNNRLIEALATRVLTDGYKLSDRIWGASGLGANYTADITNLINAGIAQGRDVVDIAKDIELYVSKGREAVFTPGRYGKLEPGTAEYKARIHKTTDYRALQLVRSELYASMQTAGVWQAQINPACTGMVDWLLSAAHIDWGCDCEATARAGPYEILKVPAYRHTNCMCRTVPVLRNGTDFVNDLATWANGGNVPYLEKWYNEIYLGFTSS